MDKLQTIQSNIVHTYEQKADLAYADYQFLSLYGKKSEAAKAKIRWDDAVAVVVAVDDALFEMRFQMRTELEKVGK
jgi:hypothetical protein